MRQLIQAGTTLPLGFLQVVRSGLWVWGAEWELPFQMGSFAVIPAREKTAFSPFQGQTPPGGPGLRSHLPFPSEANRLLPEGSGGRCAGGGVPAGGLGAQMPPTASIASIALPASIALLPVFLRPCWALPLARLPV